MIRPETDPRQTRAEDVLGPYSVRAILSLKNTRVWIDRLYPPILPLTLIDRLYPPILSLTLTLTSKLRDG